jgi:hypothetical protein
MVKIIIVIIINNNNNKCERAYSVDLEKKLPGKG